MTDETVNSQDDVHPLGKRRRKRRWIIGGLLAATAVWYFWPRPSDNSPSNAQVSDVKDDLPSDGKGNPTQHPLDPALEFARQGLARLKSTVRDYTATLIKRERIGGRLLEKEWAFVKIRQPGEVNGQPVPFSVYMKFLKPKSRAGREVIWVKGRNKNRLIAHETGFKNLFRVHLATNSWLATMGNRYPITEIGIENLVAKLIEKGERDKLQGDCVVQIRKGETVGRPCKVIRVLHPKKRPEFDFHIAEIFIDKELNLPIRYAAYMWPDKPDGEPKLDEEYTYQDLKVNVGLTEKDFDPDNEEYNYPRWTKKKEG